MVVLDSTKHCKEHAGVSQKRSKCKVRKEEEDDDFITITARAKKSQVKAKKGSSSIKKTIKKGKVFKVL
ncbi:hypothetical protein GBA52_003893 [Prunus armeniaca]|nr:hypothetical protein GBA52_003893 [Prunus armeniaca]